MTTFMTVILYALLVVWLCISICMLVATVYTFIRDRKHEKERAAREFEYYAKHAVDPRK
jgi:cbb3-type cytochrome oxidase subunit 3